MPTPFIYSRIKKFANEIYGKNKNLSKKLFKTIKQRVDQIDTTNPKQNNAKFGTNNNTNMITSPMGLLSSINKSDQGNEEKNKKEDDDESNAWKIKGNVKRKFNPKTKVQEEEITIEGTLSDDETETDSDEDYETLQRNIAKLNEIAATHVPSNILIEEDQNTNNSIPQSNFGSFENGSDPNNGTNVININFDNPGSNNTQAQKENIQKTSEFGGFIDTPQNRIATPYPQSSQTQSQQPEVQYYQMSNKRSQNQNETKMVGAPGFLANTLN